MIKRALLIIFCAAVLAAASHSWAASAGAYRTPRRTVETFANAIKVGNVPAMQACVITRNAEQAALLHAIFERQAAHCRLEKAALKKFGPRGRRMLDYGHVSIAEQLRQGLRFLKTARLVIRDRRAELIPRRPHRSRHIRNRRHAPKDVYPPMYFLKVNGKWKIDASRSIHINGHSTRRQLREAITLAKGLAAAINRTAADINGGKFRTARAAKRVLARRMTRVIDAYLAQVQKKKGLGGAPQ